MLQSVEEARAVKNWRLKTPSKKIHGLEPSEYLFLCIKGKSIQWETYYSYIISI